MMLHLAFKSLRARKATALLTIAAIAFSTMLFVGVETLRTAARDSFSNTINGTDLIVGARSGPLTLLLYSVFRIGDPTANVSAETWAKIDQHPMVAWTVPISLGDSHRGFRVMGTSQAYFDRYKYRGGRQLKLQDGAVFDDLFDVVLGARVAKQLNYNVGDKIVIGHGLGRVNFTTHEDTPFRVSGIIATTGTPVDQTLHVSMEAIEAIHLDWQNGSPKQGASRSPDELRALELKPTQVTALLVGAKSKLHIFRLQRQLNTFRQEPLSAILPGLALLQFWKLTSNVEAALFIISAFVVLTALLGMVTSIWSTLNERRREMAILRALGAGPMRIALLLMVEAMMLAAAGGVLGVLLAAGFGNAISTWVDATYGLSLSVGLFEPTQLKLLAAILGAAALAGLVPAWRAYRYSVADGMLVRS